MGVLNLVLLTSLMRLSLLVAVISSWLNLRRVDTLRKALLYSQLTCT